MEGMSLQIQNLISQKNDVYRERNQLVAALSKIYGSHLARHPDSDTEWEDDWRNIVVIYIPIREATARSKADLSCGSESAIVTTQLTWHIHDNDLSSFYHLGYVQSFQWDGHTTMEKYRRLRNIEVDCLVKYAFKCQRATGTTESDGVSSSCKQGSWMSRLIRKWLG